MENVGVCCDLFIVWFYKEWLVLNILVYRGYNVLWECDFCGFLNFLICIFDIFLFLNIFIYKYLDDLFFNERV